MATFKITLRSRDGDDGTRSYGAVTRLRCLDAREVKDKNNVDRTNENRRRRSA
jgi:hypothetical protein